MTTKKGFNELNQSLTEVVKNGQLFSRSITTDSALQKETEKANELIRQQISLVKQLYALKTQRLKETDGSVSAIAQDLQIGSVQSQLDSNRRLIDQLDEMAVKRSSLASLTAQESELATKYAGAQIHAVQQLVQEERNREAVAQKGTTEIRQTQQAYQD